MKSVNFEGEGIVPIKMDNPELVMDEKTPKNPTSDFYLKQSKRKVYADSKGLYIPANAIKASIRMSAGDLATRGKKMDSIQEVKACIFVKPDKLYLGKKKFDFISKDLVTRGKGEKVTRVWTFRPTIKKWKFKGTINFINLTAEQIKRYMEHAGLYRGLLGHRPEFGRFVIKKWVINNGR